MIDPNALSNMQFFTASYNITQQEYDWATGIPIKL